jgi:N-acetylneuraminate synthase
MPGIDRLYVIAEAGVNHNGSLERALQMVDVAAEAGADAVKFQTFRAERLVSRCARMAAYQVANTGEDGSQFDMLRRLELSEADHVALSERCRSRGIEFLSTAFDEASLHFLHGLGMSAIKVPSGDLTAAPLVLAAARLGKPLIVSTGMATLAEVQEALGVIAFGLAGIGEPSRAAFAAAYASPAGRRQLRECVTLLHCVTEYPAPPAEVNLRAMDVLREAFGLRVGYSDHTLGTAVALAAAARGADVIEKHFTLDRELPGPDHRASLVPDELARLVADVRTIGLSLGRAVKEPVAAEAKNIHVARRSLVAATAIRKGDPFTADNLAVKRPGDGASPYRYWELLGTCAPRDYAADELIDR